MPATTVANGRKPLTAWIGAGDLAVEKVRELPSEVAKLQQRITTLPNRISKVQTQVKSYADDLTTKANSVYADLASRGFDHVLDNRKAQNWCRGPLHTVRACVTGSSANPA